MHQIIYPKSYVPNSTWVLRFRRRKRYCRIQGLTLAYLSFLQIFKVGAMMYNCIMLFNLEFALSGYRFDPHRSPLPHFPRHQIWSSWSRKTKWRLMRPPSMRQPPYRQILGSGNGCCLGIGPRLSIQGPISQMGKNQQKTHKCDLPCISITQCPDWGWGRDQAGIFCMEGLVPKTGCFFFNCIVTHTCRPTHVRICIPDPYSLRIYLSCINLCYTPLMCSKILLMCY